MKLIIKLLKKTLLYLVCFLLFILASVAIWWIAATIRGDDTLEAGIDEFYHIDFRDYEKENGAVAMRGLLAPEKEKDSYAWSVEQLKKEAKTKLADIPEGKNSRRLAIELYKGLNDFDSNQDGSKSSNEKDEISFKGDLGQYNSCYDRKWVYNQKRANIKPELCDTEILNKFLQDNSLLLLRYKAALRYTKYFAPVSVMPQGEVMIKIQQIYLAKLVVDSKENREQAILDWLGNMEFYNRAIMGKVSLIELSVLLVNRGMVQRVLPEILSGDYLIAQKYQRELLHALQPIFAKDIEVEYEFKHVYYLSDPLFRALDNYNRNKLFLAHKQFIDAWKSTENTEEKRQAIYDKSDIISERFLFMDDWHSPIFSMITNLMLRGQFVGMDLAKAIDVSGNRSKLLANYVQITAKNINSDGAESFLSSITPEFYDSYTGKPFRYDSENKILYYRYPIKEDKDGYMEGIVFN